MGGGQDPGVQQAGGAGGGGLAGVVLEGMALGHRARVLADQVQVDDLGDELAAGGVQHRGQEDERDRGRGRQQQHRPRGDRISGGRGQAAAFRGAIILRSVRFGRPTRLAAGPPAAAVLGMDGGGPRPHRRQLRQRLHPPHPAGRVDRLAALALPRLRNARSGPGTTSPSSATSCCAAGAGRAARGSPRAIRWSRPRTRRRTGAWPSSTAPASRRRSPWPLVTALLVLSLIDLDHQILPDVITRPAIAVGIAASLALHRPWSESDRAPGEPHRRDVLVGSAGGGGGGVCRLCPHRLGGAPVLRAGSAGARGLEAGGDARRLSRLQGTAAHRLLRLAAGRGDRAGPGRAAQGEPHDGRSRSGPSSAWPGSPSCWPARRSGAGTSLRNGF